MLEGLAVRRHDVGGHALHGHHRANLRGQSAAGGEAFRFAAAQILCLVVSTLFVTIAIDGISLPPLVGWVTAMVPMIFFNFLLISRWVFPTGKANAASTNETRTA